jgi:signal transduction histidine kinase
LAEWLAAGGFVEAFAHIDGLEHTPEDTAAMWHERSARALCVARRAAELASLDGADAGRACLLALLSDVPQWLTADGGRCAQDSLLPAWLIESWAEIGRAAGPATSVAQHIASARKSVDAERQEEMPAAVALSPDDDIAVDRFATLARRLARLGQLERDFARELQTAKLDSLKELAYGASHEINNPLANISARAQALLDGEGDPQRRRTLASIHAQALRAHEMIGDMMLFARPPKPKLAKVELVELVSRVIAELAPWAEDQGTQLLVHACGGEIAVEADATQLAVALRALCVNALEALVNAGRVDVTLTRGHSAPEKLRASRANAQITVADTGPGISESAREHLFDPFFSGREAGRGLGF